MSSGTPKTGMAGRMRAWMSLQRRAFTNQNVCDALGIPPGRDRERVRNLVTDFVLRGEVIPFPPDRRCRQPVQRFAYNPGWHRVNRGLLNKRIYKAMRLLSFHGPFSMNEIQRHTGAPDRSYLYKVSRRLVREEYLRIVGARKVVQGKEILFRVSDPDKFYLDLVKG